MGLELSPDRKGLIGKSDKLRRKESSKTAKKWAKDLRKHRDAKKAEDALVGFKTEASFQRRKKAADKTVAQGTKKMRKIQKAKAEDKALLEMYGKGAMKARGLLRSATQKRAKKPVKKIPPGKGGPTTYIPQQTSIGGYNASGGSIKKMNSGGTAKSNEDRKKFPGMTAQEIQDAQRLGETGLADPHKGKILKRAKKSSPEEITKIGKRYAGVGAQVRETSDKFAKLQAKVRKAGGGKDVSKADMAQFKKWMKQYKKSTSKDVGLIGDYGSQAAKAKSFKRRAKMPTIRSKKRYAYGGRVAKYKD